MRRRLIGLSVAVVAWVAPAHAYNNREHQRMPDQAMQIANILRRGDHLTKKVSELTGASVVPLSTRPSTVPVSEQADWNRFIQEAKALPVLMAQVRTGLPDEAAPGSKCGNVYPVLGPGQHIAQCKARELTFAVKRGWASNSGDCSVRGNYFAGDANGAEFFNELPTDDTGALLGYYSQAVDDEVNDSIWWFCTQNAGFPAVVKNLVNDAAELNLAIVLAPFACLWSFFSGDNCFDKARDWAHQANPVSRADQLAKDLEKTLDPIRMDGDDLFSTTGVWHFINVEDGPHGDFNRIAGMHYTRGGWQGGFSVLGVGQMDALDFGIMMGGDAIGMTPRPHRVMVFRGSYPPDILDRVASIAPDRTQTVPGREGVLRVGPGWLRSSGDTLAWADDLKTLDRAFGEDLREPALRKDGLFSMRMSRERASASIAGLPPTGPLADAKWTSVVVSTGASGNSSEIRFVTESTDAANHLLVAVREFLDRVGGDAKVAKIIAGSALTAEAEETSVALRANAAPEEIVKLFARLMPKDPPIRPPT